MENKINEYKDLLKGRLKEKRYYHSLCVADEAKRLAKKYGANEDKAYLAGLLHDITKNDDKETHFKIFNKYKYSLNEIEVSSQKLWHAMSGSIYVKEVLGIKDEEIISAIRYHTTAKSSMTLLQKILYLADFTSLDRDYTDVDVMRILVDVSMEKAMKYALSYTINELVGKGAAIHPDTISAYNEIMLKEKSDDI
ncbi:MAG: bis(5'-nucleosyl)-tetraphosphatase (symmetrical) YqeK [Clostridia bacterium]|nr:bis(5'-nucleosyl)-tetraphosphatase (symmetrical) YqeK [Clostridia bacterium]